MKWCRTNRLETSDFSLISQNCIGGRVYHEFKLPFLSPTINMWVSAEDFLRLCENLEAYFSIELKRSPENDEEGTPRAKLGDITLHAVHYKSFEELYHSWNRRRQRINYNKIGIIMTDRDGWNEKMLSRFLELPYPKLLYSHIDYHFPEVIYMPEFASDGEVGIMTDKYNIWGKRLYEKHINILKWLNDNFYANSK